MEYRVMSYRVVEKGKCTVIMKSIYRQFDFDTGKAFGPRYVSYDVCQLIADQYEGPRLGTFKRIEEARKFAKKWRYKNGV